MSICTPHSIEIYKDAVDKHYNSLVLPEDKKEERDPVWNSTDPVLKPKQEFVSKSSSQIISEQRGTADYRGTQIQAKMFNDAARKFYDRNCSIRPQQQNSRLPPQQHGGGQSHAHQHCPFGPKLPMNNAPPPPQLPACGNHYYQKQRGGAPGPTRYPPCGNQTGGYNNQSRGVAYQLPAADHILHKVEVHHMAQVLEDLAGGCGVGPPNYYKVVVSTVALEDVRT
ncbi:hypothetical protein Bca101_042224 [Brassica carinata]